MKKLILLFAIAFLPKLYSQELILNPETKIYEHTYVKETTDSIQKTIISFEKKLKELNYKDINVSSDKITAGSFFSKMIMGTPIEIQYNLVIDLKDGKYRVTFNKFTLKDQRFGMVPLEDVKSAKNKWIKTINEKLPELISALESKAKEW